MLGERGSRPSARNGDEARAGLYMSSLKTGDLHRELGNMLGVSSRKKGSPSGEVKEKEGRPTPKKVRGIFMVAILKSVVAGAGD